MCLISAQWYQFIRYLVPSLNGHFIRNTYQTGALRRFTIIVAHLFLMYNPPSTPSVNGTHLSNSTMTVCVVLVQVY